MTIPTLFKRHVDHKRVIPQLNEECAWVLAGDGFITIKIDGIRCKVSKDPASNEWKLWRKFEAAPTGAYILCKKDCPADEPYFEAFDSLSPKTEGIYVAYGPDFKGNPQGADANRLVKIVPIETCLMVPAATTKIRRGATVTVEKLYDSIQSELLDSPEIEGLVFVLEQPSMCPIKWAKIERKDFGYVWPPVKAMSSTISPNLMKEGKPTDVCVCGAARDRHYGLGYCNPTGMDRFILSVAGTNNGDDGAICTICKKIKFNHLVGGFCYQVGQQRFTAPEQITASTPEKVNAPAEPNPEEAEAQALLEKMGHAGM